MGAGRGDVVQVVDGRAKLLPELGAWLTGGACALRGAGVS